MKSKKRQKTTRARGTHTHGRGFKKKARGSGHRGGVGLAGTGKRADQKKTLVLKLYGKKYFGGSKTLRRKPTPKLKTINLGEIEQKFSSLLKKGTIKEISKGKYEANLEEYKILSRGDLTKPLKIRAALASSSTIDKVKKSGGEILLQNSSDSKEE